MADDDDHDEDDARPPGRVVQLDRPRPARRRGPQGRPRSGAPFDVDGPGATTFGPRGAGLGEYDEYDEYGHHGADEDDDDGPDVTPAARLRVVTVRGGRRTGESQVVDADDEEAFDDDVELDDPDPLAVSVLHPRMRRRRITIRRIEGRRRLRRLTWVLGGLALLVDGIALAHTGFVDVDRFEVVGSTATPEAAIRAASGIDAGDALLTLDEGKAEQRIEALPWVAEADVVKQWPDTVRITVTDRVPAVVVQISDDAGAGAPLALVDATGRVLDIGAQLPGVIMVTGAPPGLAEGQEVPGVVRDALDVARATNDRLPGAVTAVSTDLDATLAGGGVVRFGSLDEIDDKVVALATVLAGVDLQCMAVLNVAVADHPALTRSC
jgi:cell division protein FtsQ